MSHSSSLDKLVQEARYLRDHLLHVEGQDGTILSSSLQPFDRDDTFEKVTDEQIQALSTAFQNAYDSALKSVDGYTLNEVLKGRSPHSYRASIPGSVVLTFIGVLLVLTAFHFSYWSNRTTFILVESEKFMNFNHFRNIMKLVELENYFDQIQEGPQTPDLEPQLVYLEGISTLRAHYTDEQELPRKMSDRIIEFNPISHGWDKWKRRYCSSLTVEDWQDGRSLLSRMVGCPEPIERRGQVIGFSPSGSRSLTGAVEAVTTSFRTKLSQIEALEKDTMTAAGRAMYQDYARSQYQVRGLAHELSERLNIVHRWALPIIYGALGSIVYCMWRVLNPNVAPVGLLYAIMRTAFAGLAALTLSMLLIPSNLFSIGADVNRPLTYLVAFIFGYSIEAFVSTLNVVNTYLSTNLTPKPRRGGSAGQ